MKSVEKQQEEEEGDDDDDDDSDDDSEDIKTPKDKHVAKFARGSFLSSSKMLIASLLTHKTPSYLILFRIGHRLDVIRDWSRRIYAMGLHSPYDVC